MEAAIILIINQNNVMSCILCETANKKTLTCQYCQKTICKTCLKEWHNDVYNGVLIDHYGPLCKCGRYGYSDKYQEWFVFISEKQVQWQGFIEKERRWLISRMQKMYKWDKKFTKKALVEYKKFICLKGVLDDAQDEILAPSDIIDKIWIEHINTQDKYIEFCLRINKEVMYRSELNLDDTSVATYNEKYSRTLALLDEDSFKQTEIWIPNEHIYRPNCQISVRTIIKRLIPIEANLDEPVFIFKYRIQLKENGPANEMNLIFNSVKLENKKSLSYYGIEKDCIIDFCLSF